MYKLFAIVVATATMFHTGIAQAQSWPSKPVRLIMPYPAGGSTDTIGRLLAERLTASLGQNVLVDNRPGASAQIGTEIAANAPADGYTLLMATSTNAINHVLNPKLPYDFIKAFMPVALIAKAGQVLVVHPSLPAKSLEEFIALSKSRPNTLTYASSGSGTSGHLAMEALSVGAKIKLVHVPYKGSSPALVDLVAGQVVSGFANVVTVLPQVKNGRLRSLAISSLKRSALAPDIPTVAELGFPDFDIAAWFGIEVREGTPHAIVSQLNQEIVKILKNRQTQEKLFGYGVDPSPIDSAQEFAEFLKIDIQRWSKLASAAGIKR